MGQEEGLLIPTKIDSSSEYKLEDKTSTGFTLSLYISPQPTPQPPLSSLSPSFYTMSQCNQINYELLAQQQQEQLTAL